MEVYKVNTPEGSKDRLFGECSKRRRVQQTVTALFAKRGYREVITPELEYYDLFVKAKNPIAPETMMKMTDREGRLVVLRPDCTTPIARIAATRLKDAVFPQRFYYNQTVYRAGSSDRGSDSELSQCGIELLGSGGFRGDVEVVALAVDALSASGAGDFHIELGHAGFFDALADSFELSLELRGSIRHCLVRKDFALLDEVLKPLGLQSSVFARLPYLFGGQELLSEALSLIKSEKAAQSLEYLRTIYGELEAAGRGALLRFDLSLTQSINYYSGLIFRGFAAGAGRVVLAGGRYDGLTGDFGLELPATGFAVYVDALTGCIKDEYEHEPETLIYYERGCLESALSILDSLPAGSASLSPYETLDETLALAARKGAKVLTAAKEALNEKAQARNY